MESLTALPHRGRGTDIQCVRTGIELQSCQLGEAIWNVAPQRVRAPYLKVVQPRVVIPSSTIAVKDGVNLRGPPRKAKYDQVTDSERVP